VSPAHWAAQASTCRFGLTRPLAAAARKGLDVALDRRRDLCHAGREGQPLGIRVLGHQVEDVADPLNRGGQDIEGHVIQPGGMDLLGHAEALLHRRESDRVDVVHGFGQSQVAEGLATQVGPGGQAAWREVVEVLVVAGNAQQGRGDGAELDKSVEVVVRDAVNLGGWARFGSAGVSGHRSNVPQRGRPIDGSAGTGGRPPGSLAVWGCQAGHPPRRAPPGLDLHPHCEGMGVARLAGISVAAGGGQDRDESSQLLWRRVAAHQAKARTGGLVRWRGLRA